MNRTMQSRSVARVGALLLVVVTLVLAAVSCFPDAFTNTVDRGKACASDTDCPFYLTCAESICRQRCGTGVACTGGPDCQYCECRTNVCMPMADAGNGYGGSNGGGGGGPNGTCAPGGTVVRSDIPRLQSSAIAMAVDATHVYLSGAVSDALGNQTQTIFAATLDGTGDVRPIWSAPSATNASGGSSIPIYRSGSSLYFIDGMLKRLPAPPPDTIPTAAEALPEYPTVVAVTKTHLFLQRNGGAGQGGLHRFDATSNKIDPTVLDVVVQSAAATDTKLVWIHRSYGGFDPDAGTDPRADNEVMNANLASGPATGTGAILPPGTSTFGAAGTSVFYLSPNGTLLELDTAKPGATPSVVLPASTGGSLTFLDSDLYVFASNSGSYCSSVSRFSLATKKMGAAVNLSYQVYGFRVVADDAWFYWLETPYNDGKSVLRRAPKD